MIKIALLSAVVVALCGCSALDQAPLVYTSKQVVGIDVSAPTTEASGITISVGFKNVDAAYVPVAVSNKVPEGSKINSMPEIKDVYATYGRGDHQDSGASQADKLQLDKVKKLEDALKRQKTAEETLTNASALVSLVTTAQVGLDNYDNTIKAAPPVENESPTPEKTAAIKAVSDAYIKLGNEPIDSLAPTNFKTIRDKLEAGKKKAQKDEEDAKKALNQTIAATNEATAQLAKSLFVMQRDAMSVFGSFDSNTTGSANTASISFGKLFSTGVAAQNISKALEASTLRAACTRALSTLSEAEESKRLMLMKECTNGTSN